MVKRHRLAVLLAMVVSALTLLWLGPVGAALASIPPVGDDEAAFQREEEDDTLTVASDLDGDGDTDSGGDAVAANGGGDTDTSNGGDAVAAGGGGDTDSNGGAAGTPTAVQGAGVGAAGAGGAGGGGAAGAGGGGGGGAGAAGGGAAGGGAAAAPAAVPVGGQLPFTGFDVPSALTAAGMLLALGGTSLALGSRRTKSR